ncbi:ABC transporter ATP-binding protein [Dokdonella fugitiva]|jgi:ABC-2 type transport system ATP-binding protein|uniref:ABC-2 type transport system ATP-binding protein n=1 Tax=Dokdonella fugitiva TaxID=328517 RepID=A0A4R2I6D2_9GAMM|nr:ABC transporter ATP-binding protein [Dokdonella fugitiva]TCO38738.1 ABC-2 type transport system ATP-binding protein [Dokdonella fugitiva]
MQQAESGAAVEWRGVRKRYGGTVALDGIDLEVRRGELLALLGPNGAGKSTAIAIALGLLPADAGEARLCGRPPAELDARRACGVMLQSAGLPDSLKVRELLELTCSYYAAPRTIAGCAGLAGLDGLLDRRYGRLSGGEQRRVQFALAICGNPRLLFLDEPTTGLDLDARGLLWRAIRAMVEAGCAVVMTTHYLEEAEALADRVAVLARGRIVACGSVQQVRARVSQRRIRCVSVLDAARVGAWPEVRSVCRDGDRIEIVTDQAEVVVRQLLFEDSGLSQLEVQRAGLADAFVEITREAA